ncbi:Bro-N domain-containing protein [Streptomyces bugieae]|uniref:Bro-N domain-containing protein n=1 Tax=Streptomyces bugieae TaxID=3098223 RepID=A0ABU7NL07_9ACTN|nr:Bro-N domain-containing protein [Streptomyces sp. DSM 41528]
MFTFPETAQQVRSVTIDAEPWWVAADICAVLELSNPRQAVSHLDEDEVRQVPVTTADGSGRTLPTNVISEPGLYSLVLRSRKPQAKAFKRWVTHEVIPQIRKQGKYDPAAAKELTAAAGPLPYRDQAEILAILRPVLPEHYATATGKVILARAMGERPELESGETPLYASTFLAEKGHKPATVAKFQSGFGSRVSNRYLKVHGRRPEKIPGPAGSRIDKVVVYSEEDRPLLEEVYAEVAEAILEFEGGGQLPLDAGRAA